MSRRSLNTSCRMLPNMFFSLLMHWQPYRHIHRQPGCRRWSTGFHLNGLTEGSSKDLGLHSDAVNAVCGQHRKSRSQKKRPYPRYRATRNSGWIPLKGREMKREGDAFRFAGNSFRVFNSRALLEEKLIFYIQKRMIARQREALNGLTRISPPIYLRRQFFT